MAMLDLCSAEMMVVPKVLSKAVRSVVYSVDSMAGVTVVRKVAQLVAAKVAWWAAEWVGGKESPHRQ
jgi:hypothetical protein